MRLKDKVILITGSTTGIGAGMARVCAREGARVIIHGTREAVGAKLVEEIRSAGGEAFFVAASLSDPDAASRLIDAAVAHGGGRLDGLVNNAAVMTRSDLETTTSQVFDDTMAINLRAPLLLIRAALPHFRRQGGGRVLNIGSVNGHCGERNQLAYSLSKAGMMTLTRNLADAYGAEGLRINALNVGWTLTPNEFELKKREGLPDDWPERLPRSLAPSGRLLSPEDIAWAAVYLLSDEAPLLNGGVLDFEQYPVIGRNPIKES